MDLQPERCADPRSVRSTPTVMIVRAYQCGQSRVSDERQILGLDSRTGERIWTQTAADDGDSGPNQVVVGDGYQLELTNKHLEYRRLDTGEISWTAPAASSCDRNLHLASSPATAYAVQCQRDPEREPTSLTAFAITSGQLLWQQANLQPVNSLVAVDDRRVLALTAGEGTCELQLVQESGIETLFAMLAYSAENRERSNTVRCNESAILRVGNAFVLQFAMAAENSTNPPTFLFVGLG